MAAEAAQVAQRCEEAKFSQELMLNECGLRKFPDAIFLLLKGVDIQRVSLAHNQFPKLPVKVPASPVFASVTSFELSHNNLSSLPDSMPSLQKLSKINLSSNQFESVPNILSQLPTLKVIDLSSNKIETVDQAVLDSLPDSLEVLDLSNNPLTDEVKAQLRGDRRVKF